MLMNWFMCFWLYLELCWKVDFQERAPLLLRYSWRMFCLFFWLQTPPCWWQSCIFSIITPVLSDTWPFRNHSNMLTFCSRNIYYYYQCWNVIINEKREIHFQNCWWSWRTFIWNTNFINVFTVPFDKINTSLLNKSIIFLYTVVYFSKSSLNFTHPKKNLWLR